MPKISTNPVRINHKDFNASYTIQIYYNQQYGFFGIIPPEFDNQFDHLSATELKKWKGVKVFKTKYASGDFKRAVSCTTETETLTAAKNFIEHLMDFKIEKRNVIILFYEGDSNHHYSGREYNKNHGQIGMNMGLSYCVETKIGNSKPKYSIYRTEKQAWNDDKIETVRTEISTWNEKIIVIDDTAENRKFLETLYGSFQNLIKTINKFTKGPKELMGLIKSQQKLLN